MRIKLAYHALALVLAIATAANAGQPWCRVHCSDGSSGSGTLIDINDTQGLCITAFHVVRDVVDENGTVTGQIACEFQDIRKDYGATLVSYDEKHDLAALLINKPDATPVMLAEYDGVGKHTVYGFPGGRGLQTSTGVVANDDQFSMGGSPVVFLTCPALPGHSGGGVVTDRGLVGVAWGCDDSGEASVTAGEPFNKFISSLQVEYTQYPGKCWKCGPNYRPPGPILVQRPATYPPATPVQPARPPQAADDWPAKRKEIIDYIDKRIAELDCGDKVTQAQLVLEINRIRAEIDSEIDSRVDDLPKQLEYVPPSYKDQAAGILPHLPPIYVEWETLDGQTLEQNSPLGGVLKFKSVEVNKR